MCEILPRRVISVKKKNDCVTGCSSCFMWNVFAILTSHTFSVTKPWWCVCSSFTQLGNSVKGKDLTMIIMYVEKLFFQKVKFYYRATKYKAPVVQQVLHWYLYCLIIFKMTPILFIFCGKNFTRTIADYIYCKILAFVIVFSNFNVISIWTIISRRYFTQYRQNRLSEKNSVVTAVDA